MVWRSKKEEENFGGRMGLLFSSKGRRNLAGTLMGKGGPEGLFTTTGGAIGFLLLALGLEEERLGAFLGEALDDFFEEDFEAFLDLDFVAMKFQT
jgi:hypothetical protein